MKDALAYCLAFSHFLGIGPIKFNALLAEFGSERAAYTASRPDLSRILGPKLAQEFEIFRNNFDIKQTQKKIEAKGITVLIRKDERFPQTLIHIADTPICLYVLGKMDSVNFNNDLLIAVVGTRKITSNGDYITKSFSWTLIQKGIVIVSGMALGVDTVAHKTALEAGGKTVAVLGCGVDIVYPPDNRRLYNRIIAGGGLVVSEFPPGMTTLPGLFVARNRIISGLSSGVLVVEGSEKSGALITAKYAAEQGKEVFAPPGPLNSSMSAAPHLLLKQGAKLTFSPEDILEELGFKKGLSKKEQRDLNLTKDEAIIFEILSNEPKPADEISNTNRASLPAVLNTLSLMEIKGIIEKNSEGMYQIKI